MSPTNKSSSKISKKKKLLINADQPEECRAAIVDDGKLEEFIVEQSSRELIKGNIYLGVISRVEPSIEAAFVDIGGKKFGFLPFKDVLKESYLKTREKKAKVRIQDVLIRGQKIMVQVVKESREAKGPSLTNVISIPGRFLVLMYGSPSSGVSRKIEDEAERKKLKEIISDLEMPDNIGVIIRTAGVGRTKSELQKDFQMLLKIWENIQSTMKSNVTAPCMLHQGPDMVVRTVRDHFTADTSEIIVDNVQSFKAVKDFINLVMPRMRNRVKLHQDTEPLFSACKLEEQIESIYHRRVELPSGGSIIIDMGEAMVSIDVNSGKTTGASELEDTALKTNLEAAEEVARQLRLRDLGGLVVIDFIDMFQKKNKTAVENQVKKSCKIDKARINLSRISRFGLLEMSRQRLSPPVQDAVYETCSSCQGWGKIKTHSALSLLVLRRIREAISDKNVQTLGVTIPSSVATYLLNHKADFLLNLQSENELQIKFAAEENLTPDDYRFEILERKEVKTAPEKESRKTSDKDKKAPARAKKEKAVENEKVEKDVPSSKVVESKEDNENKEESAGPKNQRRRSTSSNSRSRTSRRTPSGNRKTTGTRTRRWRRPKADVASGNVAESPVSTESPVSGNIAEPPSQATSIDSDLS